MNRTYFSSSQYILENIHSLFYIYYVNIACSSNFQNDFFKKICFWYLNIIQQYKKISIVSELLSNSKIIKAYPKLYDKKTKCQFILNIKTNFVYFLFAIQIILNNFMKAKKKNDSDSDDDQSIDSEQLNTDNSPKPIPVAKISDKLKHKKIVINISDTQYPIVQQIAEELGWIIQRKQGVGDWDVWWTDRQINPDVLFRMNLHQKINHFPGIYVLARKNLLGLHLMGMKQQFNQQYSFFPQTWVIPLQFSQFRNYYQNCQQGKVRTYIVKPQALSQGRGIFLTRNIDDIINGNKYVVQRYVKKPLLIDGLKFDLRIYVLIAGTDPLRLYIYQQGLTRLATQKYEEPTQANLHKSFIHLTNYSLNKNNPNYIYNTSENNMNVGHKRTLTSTYQYLAKLGHNVENIKAQIEDVIVKTVISGLPLISHQYQYCQPQEYEGNMCFHILGFDIMLASDLKPILIEVNHTPSFQTSTPLDYHIKKRLIKDTLLLMRITSKNKKILFEKSKILTKKRIETGKRQIFKGPERERELEKACIVRNEVQKNLLGGYKIIHPTGDPVKQAKYQLLKQHAKKVQKESHGLRKTILKEYSGKPIQKDKDKIIKSESKKHKNDSEKLSCKDGSDGSQISPTQLNFRSKTTKKVPNEQKYSSAKLNEIMLKLISPSFTDIPLQKSLDVNQYIAMKQLMLVKKHSLQNSIVDNKMGAYIVPKSYEINGGKILQKPKQKLASIQPFPNIIRASQNSKEYDKIRKKSLL